MCFLILEIASNVEYAEVTLPSHHHLRFIPNTYYGTTPDWKYVYL